jgi:hypothetical protein
MTIAFTASSASAPPMPSPSPLRTAELMCVDRQIVDRQHRGLAINLVCSRAHARSAHCAFAASSAKPGGWRAAAARPPLTTPIEDASTGRPCTRHIAVTMGRGATVVLLQQSR